jgi:hypothetical protein
MDFSEFVVGRKIPLSKTALENSLIPIPNILGNNLLVGCSKVILVCGSFVGYLERRKPTIHQAKERRRVTWGTSRD